jgi:hypothetical protein
MKEDTKTLTADMSIIFAIGGNGGDTALHLISCMHAMLKYVMAGVFVDEL